MSQSVSQSVTTLGIELLSQLKTTLQLQVPRALWSLCTISIVDLDWTLLFMMTDFTLYEWTRPNILVCLGSRASQSVDSNELSLCSSLVFNKVTSRSSLLFKVRYYPLTVVYCIIPNFWQILLILKQKIPTKYWPIFWMGVGGWTILLRNWGV